VLAAGTRAGHGSNEAFTGKNVMALLEVEHWRALPVETSISVDFHFAISAEPSELFKRKSKADRQV